MPTHEEETFRAVTGGGWKSLRTGVVQGSIPAGTKTMLIGSGNANSWSSFNAALNALSPATSLRVCRSYEGGSTPTNFLSSVAATDYTTRHCQSYWSCAGETIATIASGNATRLNAIGNFAASIPSDHKMFISYWHEVDLHNKGGSFTTAQIQQAQANIYDAIKNNAQTPANILVGPLLTHDGYGVNGVSNNPAQYFPTDSSKFDFCGVDFYQFMRPQTSINVGLTSPTTTYWMPPPDPKAGNYGSNRSPAYLCDAAKNYANSVGKKMVIGEYSAHPFPTSPSYFKASDGSVDVLSRPYRVQACIDYHDAAGTLAFCFFHASAGGSGPWWLDAFHQFAGSTDPTGTHPVSAIDPTDHTTYPDPDTMNQLKAILDVRAP